jgi:hypothetical protein
MPQQTSRKALQTLSFLKWQKHSRPIAGKGDGTVISTPSGQKRCKSRMGAVLSGEKNAFRHPTSVEYAAGKFSCQTKRREHGGEMIHA